MRYFLTQPHNGCRTLGLLTVLVLAACGRTELDDGEVAPRGPVRLTDDAGTGDAEVDAASDAAPPVCLAGGSGVTEVTYGCQSISDCAPDPNPCVGVRCTEPSGASPPGTVGCCWYSPFHSQDCP